MVEFGPEDWILKRRPVDVSGDTIKCDDGDCLFGDYELGREETVAWKSIMGGFACAKCRHIEPPVKALQPGSSAPEAYQCVSARFMATAQGSSLPYLRELRKPEVEHIDAAIERFGITNTVEQNGEL